MPRKPHSIDWETVWNSLNWDDTQRQQAVEAERLRQRARQYAAPVKESADLPGDSRSLLTFVLGSEQYGVDAVLVRGVRPVTRVARVPGVPSFYRGVVNVRGRVITVMDLRCFFNITIPEGDAMPGEMVIVQANNLEIGLLAHQVNGVAAIAAAAIRPVEHMPYLAGMTGSRLVILNIAQLFEDERLIVGGVNPGGQQDDERND